MRAVTVSTISGAGGAKFVADTVNAGGVLASLLFMAGGAAHRQRFYIVIGMLRGEVGMATGTGGGIVDGSLMDLIIHEIRSD